MSTEKRRRHEGKKGAVARKHEARAASDAHAPHAKRGAAMTVHEDDVLADGAAAADVLLTPEEQVTANEALARITPRAMALRRGGRSSRTGVPALAIVNVRVAKAGARAASAARWPRRCPTPRSRALRRARGHRARALGGRGDDADKVRATARCSGSSSRRARYRGRLLAVLHALAVNGRCR